MFIKCWSCIETRCMATTFINCEGIISHKRKRNVTVAMATVLLRHPMFIKCWSCHRNKAGLNLRWAHMYVILLVLS